MHALRASFCFRNRADSRSNCCNSASAPRVAVLGRVVVSRDNQDGKRDNQDGKFLMRSLSGLLARI
jgi:hypothetical protein